MAAKQHWTAEELYEASRQMREKLDAYLRRTYDNLIFSHCYTRAGNNGFYQGFKQTGEPQPPRVSYADAPGPCIEGEYRVLDERKALEEKKPCGA